MRSRAGRGSWHPPPPPCRLETSEEKGRTVLQGGTGKSWPSRQARCTGVVASSLLSRRAPRQQRHALVRLTFPAPPLPRGQELAPA